MDQLTHGPALDVEPALDSPTTKGGVGKSTLTSRLSSQVVFRVADPETARALGEALSGGTRVARAAAQAAGLRDDNGVAADAEAAGDRAASSTGAPLPTHIQRQFEGSMGADLSSVRVHTGGESQEAAQAVGAKAYTVGNDIHFAAGRYQPEDPFGMHLLAHEVAHTVQQSGGAQRRQHKLEVSTPHDAAEHEADRAADAMVRGEVASVGGGAGRLGRVIQRDSLGEQMERSANDEEAAVAGGGIVVGDSSSVWSADEAKRMQQTVVRAQGNLQHRLAHWTRLQGETKGSGAYKQIGAIDKEVSRNSEIIKGNEAVIASLQELIDMSQGNAQLSDKGENTAGYDFRTQMFHGLVANCRRDFARLSGVVKTILGANPKVKDEGGFDAGADIGRAAAGGNTANAHKGIVAATASDKELDNLMNDYKGAHKTLTGANYAKEIDRQMGKCAAEKSTLRNLTTNISLGTQRPDTPEEEKAKKEVETVNSDLASAKGFLDKVESVLKKVATIAVGAPVGAAIDAAGEKMPDIRDLVKDSGKALDIAGMDVGGTVEKGISEYVKTEIAKVMTDYETRIDAANGKLKTIQLGKLRIESGLNVDQIKVAKGKVVAEANALGDTLAQMAAKKAELRALTARIVDHQKKHKKPGQPDIGGITQALTETSAYLVQADAAILQGKEEKKLYDKMSAKRDAVVGSDVKAGTKKEAFTGTKEVATMSKAQAYYDCENKEPFLYSQHPLTYRIWEDNQKQTFEGAHNEIEPQLKDLEETRATAAGMETALKNAMFGQ